jgi:hypothetical protein
MYQCALRTTVLGAAQEDKMATHIEDVGFIQIISQIFDIFESLVSGRKEGCFLSLFLCRLNILKERTSFFKPLKSTTKVGTDQRALPVFEIW